MNRRSFITKALAGLAMVPLIGKLVTAQPSTERTKPQHYGRSITFYHYPGYDIRRSILRDIARDGQTTLTQSEFLAAFDGWNYGRLTTFCDEHDLLMWVGPKGPVTIRRNTARQNPLYKTVIQRFTEV